MANMPGARHATTIETIKIHDILKRVLTANEDGTFSFIEGYNDDIVAKEVSPTLSKHSVQGVRTKVFGRLHKNIRTDEPEEYKVIDKLNTQVKNITERLNEVIPQINNAIGYVNSLEDRLNDLDQRFDKLVAMLALNRVVDCKHLGTPHKNGDKK